MLDKLSAEKHDSYKIIRLDETGPAEHLDNPALQGQHNQQNSAAARVICRQFGLTDDIIDKAYKALRGYRTGCNQQDSLDKSASLMTQRQQMVRPLPKPWPASQKSIGALGDWQRKVFCQPACLI